MFHSLKLFPEAWALHFGAGVGNTPASPAMALLIIFNLTFLYRAPAVITISKPYHVPGIFLSTLQLLSHLILKTAIWNVSIYIPIFEMKKLRQRC